MLLGFALCFNLAFGQLQVNSGNSVEWYVQNVLVGSGVTVSNVTFTGTVDQLGDFANGNSTNIGQSEGLIISTGQVVDAVGS